MRKRINKILWHGDELLEEKAKAPGIATSADGLDGLNEGEIYISNNEKDPALFIRTSSGKVVRVGVNYEELKKLFLSRTDDDTAEGLITFEKGVRIKNLILKVENDVLSLTNIENGKRAHFAASGTVSSLGVGTTGGGGGSSEGGASALYQLLDVLSDGTKVEGAEDGSVLTYDENAGKWKATKIDIPETDLTEIEGQLASIDQLIKALQGKDTEHSNAITALQQKDGEIEAAIGSNTKGIESIQKQLDTLVSGDASDAIESFNEVVAFLKDIEDTETLEGILAGKQNKIDTDNKLDYSLLANTPLLADFMGSSAIGGTASSDNFSAVYWDGKQWQTRTIYKWALASAKPSYTTSEVTEGTRLYFTDDRAKDALKSTTDALSDRIAKFEKMFQWGNGEDSYVKTPFSFASDKTVSSLGVGSSEGGGVSYNRLDSWDIYTADKAGYVLSAALGWDLKTRLDNLDLGDFDLSGYLTKSEAQNTYATISALNGKQNAITANNKLSASLVSGLATVATSGKYGDLSGLPTFGSLAFKDNLTASDIPSLSWSKITSDKPTTLEGYGITDGISTSNIGSQSVNYATSAGSSDTANILNKVYSENINYDAYSSHVKLIKYNSNWQDNGFPTNWTSGLSVQAGYVGWQLLVYGGDTDTLYFRKNNDSNTWREWKTIAFTDSNVASATKLATARTIWGQSFDGSGDVSGDLRLNGSNIRGYNNYNLIEAGSGGVNIGYGYQYYGLPVSLWGSPISFAASGNYDMTIKSNGNVLMGTTTDYGYKLFVNGNSYVNGSFTVANSVTIGDAKIWWDATNKVLRTDKSFASDKTVSSLGVGTESGGGVSYNRLDSWDNYTDDKAGYVLSAALGRGLKDRLDNLDLGDFDLSGYLTKSEAQNTYATIGSLAGYLPLSGGTLSKPLTISSGNDTKFILNNTDTDSKYQFISFRQNNTEYGQLGTSGGDDLVWGKEGLWKTIIHTGNLSDYALPLSGGTIENSFIPLTVKRSNNNPTLIKYENSKGVLGYIGIDNDSLYPIFLDGALSSSYYILHSGNIGSQSVSYATSAGSASNATKWNNFNYQNIVTDGQNKNQCFKLITIRIKSSYTNSCISFDISGRSKGVAHIEVHPYNSSTIGSSHIGSLRIIGDSLFADKIRGYVIGNETDSSGNIVAKVIEVWMTKRSEGYDSVVISNVHYGNNESVTVNATEHSSLPTSYESYVDATMGSIYGSITKLTTPRTIWGQSFDGTGNVSGVLYMGNNQGIYQITTGSTYIDTFRLSNANNLLVGYGVATVGCDSKIYGNNVLLYYGTSHTTGFTLNSSGNVTIGGSDLAGTSNKLYVNGNSYVNGSITCKSTYIAEDIARFSRSGYAGISFQGISETEMRIMATDKNGSWSANNFKVFSDGSVYLGGRNATTLYVKEDSIEANKGINIYGTLTGYVSGTDSDTWSITNQGAATFSDTLTVQGKTELESGLDVIGLIQGLDSVGGDTTWKITSDGAATFGSTLKVTGATTLGDKLTISKNGMSVTGAAYFGGGTTYYFGSTGNVSANTLTAAGATSLKSTLAVTGASTFTGKTTHNGGLGATSGTFSTTLGVTGATSLKSTLSVTGATTLSSTLGVSGDATFNSKIYIGGDDAYIYWDASKKVLRTNVSFASDKTVSSLGVGSDSGGSGGSADWGAVPTDIIPISDDYYNIGSPSLRFSEGHFNNVYADAVEVGSCTIYSNGNASFGSLSIGGADAATQTWVNTRLASYISKEGGTVSGTLTAGTAIYTGEKTAAWDGKSGAAIMASGNLVLVGTNPHIYFGYGNATTSTSSLEAIDDGGFRIVYNMEVFTSTVNKKNHIQLNYGNTRIYRLNNDSSGMQFQYGTSASSVSTKGTFSTSGAYSASSDITKKNILSYNAGFNVHNIAEAPIAYFTWKDLTDNRVNLGSIAQYWQLIAPECIYGTEGIDMTMDYSTLGLVSSIINARAIVSHENEIDKLKKRVEELESKNKRLQERVDALVA